MKLRILKQKNKHQIMRLLTLVCFFHFSGLNNGFSYFVISAGRIESVSFAPVFIQSACRIFNPASWKNIALNVRLFSLCSKSSRVIEYASQRAVQGMLVESSILQIWLKGSLNKPVEFQNDKQGSNGHPAIVLIAEKVIRGLTLKIQEFVPSLTKPMSSFDLKESLRYLDRHESESYLIFRKALLLSELKNKGSPQFEVKFWIGKWRWNPIDQLFRILRQGLSHSFVSLSGKSHPKIRDALSDGDPISMFFVVQNQSVV